MPIIPATQDAEARVLKIQGQSSQFRKTLSQMNKNPEIYNCIAFGIDKLETLLCIITS
jgi:hypothetical protein